MTEDTTETKFDILLAELKDIYVAQHQVKKMQEQLIEVNKRLDAQQQAINRLNTYKQDIVGTQRGFEFD